MGKWERVELVAVMCAVGGVLVWFVLVRLPGIEKLFEDMLGPGGRLPMLTEWLFRAGDFPLLSAVGCLLPACFGICGVFAFSAREARLVSFGCIVAMVALIGVICAGVFLPVVEITRALE